MKPPPEEKLLKLIRGHPARAAAPGLAPGAEAASPALPRSRPLSRVSWLAWAIGGLSLAVLIELGGLLIEATRPSVVIRAPMLPVEGAAAEPVAAAASAAPLEEIPSLAASAAGAVFAASGGSSPSAPRAPQSATLKQLAARLTLMGIVSGEPSQAIIEDAETHKTYFAIVGQAVADGAIVDQVLDGRVILDVDGEKLDLAL